MDRLQQLFGLLILASPLGAAEPWADPKLPVKEGLALWLDASRVAGAEKAAVDPRVAKWQDASRKGRHLAQPKPELQPVRLPAGPLAVVRFDGLDDHLRNIQPAGEAKAFTVFLLAASRSNPAPFLGLLAFNAPNRRDYESGLTIDHGPTATTDFTYLNVEGRGFGGAKNLRTIKGPFGKLRTLEVIGNEKSVNLVIDGKVEGQRPRSGEPVSLAEITLGARYYNNGPGPQSPAGFSRCDIAEVIVYDRALSAAEAKQVRDYLDQKYAAVKTALPPDAGEDERLVPVKDAPPVQVLVPGFTVRELPLQLTNINNIRYRADGALIALGYDGNIWKLTDTNGDGLEDNAERIYENKGSLTSPIGMDLTPPNYPHGQGVFTTSPGKCVLLVDSDGDGILDKEITVAGGWTDRSVNIDVVGVAVDPKDGSVWFGRGCANYTNGYLINKEGKSEYSLKDERGTIQRVAPDFKSREIIATGIRFSVGMRFNKDGDLFCTDQEGATWLPNGNPFDELLHIRKGRHYGFPPRHPTHLPNVIDEPSVFDYSPQHQSTCGFCFNDGPKTFGPDHWKGDAFVTGESRGKLWRTKLVTTPHGFVASNELFACLSMLTIDCCLTPDGSMLVACHSGGPDWGTGPKGKGKLFKISYTDKAAPQPVLAWPASPREIRVAFDKPVDPTLLKDALSQTKVTAGKFVRAGDRFETIWPGYAVVATEKVTPRINVPVHSVNLTADGRTLVLAVDPIPSLHVAVMLPGLGRKDVHPQIDLAFDLSGCEASWVGKDGATWTGWLPSADLDVARAFTDGSAEHDLLWKTMNGLGTLTLKTKLQLNDLLRPAVQPGSQLDHVRPQERVTVAFESNAQVTAKSPNANGPIRSEGNSGRTIGEIGIEPKPGQLYPTEFRLNSSMLSTAPTFSLSWFTQEDKQRRPLSPQRTLAPWAEAKTSLAVLLPKPQELEGGSWARGRKVFFSNDALCSKCHSVSGQGGAIGPDLTNLIHRDYTSVLRDIEKPNFALNPDHLTYIVQLKDGRTLTGVMRLVGGKISIGDLKGEAHEIDGKEIESVKPSATSTMPDDLVKKLGPEKVKDLMTYLLTNPVSMPRDLAKGRPKPRSIAEVNAVLSGSTPAKTRPIRVVLVAGPKDHGPGEHDYPAWQKAWKELLGAAENIEVVTAWEFPPKEEFTKADAMVFFQRGDWNAERAAAIDAYLERGGGLTYIHWAVDGRADGPGFAKRIGMAAKGGAVGFRHGDMVLDFKKEAKHPVLRNFDKLALTDETYWKMFGELNQKELLGDAVEEGQPRPQVWAVERGNGRVFVSIPGHYSWTFDDPLFRILLLRGIAWTAKEPVDRFNDLVWPGANVAK